MTDTDTPVWLLDVDGVINVPRPGWGDKPHRGMAYSEDGRAYKIRWAPLLIRRIQAIHDSGLVEIRWCTTWCRDIDEVERLFAPLRFRFALTAEGTSATTWPAKEAAARQVVASGRPLVWTDGQIPEDGPIREDLRDADVPFLLIAPKPSAGLQPSHMELIEYFLGDPLASMACT